MCWTGCWALDRLGKASELEDALFCHLTDTKQMGLELPSEVTLLRPEQTQERNSQAPEKVTGM